MPPSGSSSSPDRVSRDGTRIARVKRWKNDRQRKKKERQKRKTASALLLAPLLASSQSYSGPSATSRKRGSTSLPAATRSRPPRRSHGPVRGSCASPLPQPQARSTPSRPRRVSAPASSSRRTTIRITDPRRVADERQRRRSADKADIVRPDRLEHGLEIPPQRRHDDHLLASGSSGRGRAARSPRAREARPSPLGRQPRVRAKPLERCATSSRPRITAC